jgi:hypothetical protein
LTRGSLALLFLTRVSLAPHFLTRDSLAALARASEWFGILALTLVPVPALACAVCAGGNPANRFAFFASTIVLSLLPLGLFAVGFLWLRARLRARGTSEFMERDPLVAVPGPVPPVAPTRPEAPTRDPGDPRHPAVPAR